MADQYNPQQQQQRQVQIKITDDVLKGVHANMMGVSHTREEFIIDFMNLYPAQGQGIVTSRVIVSPGHMKRIMKALDENIKKYEKQFDTIKEAEAPGQEIGFKTA